MRYIYIFLAGLVCLLCTACATLPRPERAATQIQLAESALNEARTLQADVYASETYLDAVVEVRQAHELATGGLYDEARDMAEQAESSAFRASNESRRERIRVRSQAERLLFSGRQTWHRYEQSRDHEYALDALIAIRKQLDTAESLLQAEREQDALSAVQDAQQRLVRFPQDVEQGRMSRLEAQQKRESGRQTAGQIIAHAEQRAAEIVATANEKARQIELEARLAAAQARLEEFERMFPSTYQVKQGETMRDIARRHEIFNDTFMWPLIYKANRDQIRDPQMVFPGQRLAIPRDLSLDDIIQARKQANASPPYLPPPEAYSPEFYRRYMLIAPEPDADAQPAPQIESAPLEPAQ